MIELIYCAIVVGYWKQTGRFLDAMNWPFYLGKALGRSIQEASDANT